MYSVIWPGACIIKVSNKRGGFFVVLFCCGCFSRSCGDWERKGKGLGFFLFLFEESWLLSSKGSETVCKSILHWSKASHLFLVTTGHHCTKRIRLALCLSSICIFLTSLRWFSRITCHWNWNSGDLSFDGKVFWDQGRISGQPRKNPSFGS